MLESKDLKIIVCLITMLTLYLNNKIKARPHVTLLKKKRHRSNLKENRVMNISAWMLRSAGEKDTRKKITRDYYCCCYFGSLTSS